MPDFRLPRPSHRRSTLQTAFGETAKIRRSASLTAVVLALSSGGCKLHFAEQDQAATPMSATAGVQTKGIQLNSSINIYDQEDLARCPQTVREAFGLGNHSLSFTPTVFAPVDFSEGARTTQFHFRTNATLTLLDDRGVRSLYEGYKQCFKALFATGIRDVTILPHADAIPSMNRSELGIALNPKGKALRQDCSGFLREGPLGVDSATFYDVLIHPLSCALGQAIAELQLKKNDTQVNFNLSGEMSTTLVYQALEYQLMGEATRKILQDKTRFLLGVSFNWSAPLFIIREKDRNRVPKFENLQSFLKNLDFLGISAYAQLEDLVGPADQKAVTAIHAMHDCCGTKEAAADVLKQFHFDWQHLDFKRNWDSFMNWPVPEESESWDLSKSGLKNWDLLKDLNVELHYSEVGLGGGDSRLFPYGDHWFRFFRYPFLAPDDCGFRYASKDRPESEEVYLPHLESYYKRVLASLNDRFYRRSGVKGAKAFRITRAYLWNSGSFDVQGLHQTGKACQKPSVTALIKRHNQQVGTD